METNEPTIESGIENVEINSIESILSTEDINKLTGLTTEMINRMRTVAANDEKYEIAA